MKLYRNIVAFLVSILYCLVFGQSNSTVSLRSKGSSFFNDPDEFRNVSELISSKGYPVQDHVVQTKDGYLLCIQRIPHGKIETSQTKKQVVLLQHGQIDSSAHWVINFPHQSLGFILSDMNYDVWLGNTRGNTYSKHHIILKSDEEEFWNFSFDEMALYDLPAMIDYILNVTGEKDLIYVGHSQGTTTAFALLSDSREINEKIKLFIALSPVVSLEETPAGHLLPFAKEMLRFFHLFGKGEYSRDEVLKTSFCGLLGKSACDEMFFSIFSNSEKLLNETRMPVYIAHLDSSSTKNQFHYMQLFDAKRFQKFDYGELNLQHYKQVTPPEYDITKIRTPTALFWAESDLYGGKKSAKSLERKLKYLVKSYCVPSKDFSHIDFIYALEARSLLYDEVLAVMKIFRKF